MHSCSLNLTLNVNVEHEEHSHGRKKKNTSEKRIKDEVLVVSQTIYAQLCHDHELF